MQGITGREASMVSKQMLQYGTKIVAGVSPGKGSQSFEGVPVYDSVQEAVLSKRPNVSVIYVPPSFVRDAALEAIENGIQLVLIITERVPEKDTIELIARAQSKGCQIIGPNIGGLVMPTKRIKLGPLGGDNPERMFVPGHVAIISRSGGMSAEIGWMLKRSGQGTRLSVSIGGDPILGTTMKEMLQILQDDPETHAAVLFCEPGGDMESEVAELAESRGFTKPIVAHVAGRFTERLPRGIKFGHAGAIIRTDAGLPSVKLERFKQAGVKTAERISDIPTLISSALAR
jgi:succinyl-CoA synthetase alpha subunit